MGAVLLLGGCGGGGGSAPVASLPAPTPVPSPPPPSSSAANYVLTITRIGQAQSDSNQFQGRFAPPPATQAATSNAYALLLDSMEASATSP